MIRSLAVGLLIYLVGSEVVEFLIWRRVPRPHRWIKVVDARYAED